MILEVPEGEMSEDTEYEYEIHDLNGWLDTYEKERDLLAYDLICAEVFGDDDEGKYHSKRRTLHAALSVNAQNAQIISGVCAIIGHKGTLYLMDPFEKDCMLEDITATSIRDTWSVYTINQDRWIQMGFPQISESTEKHIRIMKDHYNRRNNP